MSDFSNVLTLWSEKSDYYSSLITVCLMLFTPSLAEHQVFIWSPVWRHFRFTSGLQTHPLLNAMICRHLDDDLTLIQWVSSLHMTSDGGNVLQHQTCSNLTSKLILMISPLLHQVKTWFEIPVLQLSFSIILSRNLLQSCASCPGCLLKGYWWFTAIYYIGGWYIYEIWCVILFQ